MKIHSQFVILLLLLLTAGCNKKETTPHITSIEGKWQLIKSVGGIAGAEQEIKDKRVVVFQDNKYQYYLNDELVDTKSYLFEPVDDKTWKLTINDGFSGPGLVRFSGNLLIQEDLNPDMYTRTYRKIN